MKFVLLGVAAIAVLFGMSIAVTAVNDMQIGIAVNAVFSAAIMVGLAVVIARGSK